MQFKSLLDYTANELPPNPQFFRDDWLDLCGEWGFAHDDDDCGIDEGWPCRSDDVFRRKIHVPFPPESKASGIHDPSSHPIVWYRRTFTVERKKSERVMLNFGAVDYAATVWVNGRLVARHEGGHTPFAADITCELNDGEEQVLVVRAEDQPLDMSQPRGKQDWMPDPHIIWYYRTTGIWQPVWLEVVSPVHISEVRWTPRMHRLGLRMIAHLSRTPAKPLRMRVRLWLHGSLLIEDTCLVRQREIGREFILPINDLAMQLEEILWSPEHPNLIEAELCLLDEDQEIDTLRTYTGLRSATVGNGRFLLNGRPYYLRSVLEQGYWPESHLVAPSPEALMREAELIKELGFNSVRIHQKVEDPRFLYWCDRLGLTVWGEMANSYAYTWQSAERLTREWMEVLKRDFSHPCIITWVPVNESWGVPTLAQDERQREHLRALYALTKSFDLSRPVVDNDGWEHVRTDIITIHDYSRRGATIRERYGTDAALANLVQTGRPLHYPPLLDEKLIAPDAPVMLTEFGGLSYKPEPETKWFGYGTVTSAQEYIDNIRDLVEAVCDCPGIAGFCYTQLTDTEQETNGLLDAKRQPKFDISVIRSIFAPEDDK